MSLKILTLPLINSSKLFATETMQLLLRRLMRLRTLVRTSLRLTFIKNRKLIQNMTSSTLSNGPIEGVNQKIKQIKGIAYGYRNWKNYVFRIQIEFKIRVKKRNLFRK
ncbi:transposase [Secundilactobacillus collinoides]|uniref:transposase n=1 Tax=Secundilactobacillus collinoides TaxID=33960 RepID=UPI003B837EE8